MSFKSRKIPILVRSPNHKNCPNGSSLLINSCDLRLHEMPLFSLHASTGIACIFPTDLRFGSKYAPPLAKL